MYTWSIWKPILILISSLKEKTKIKPSTTAFKDMHAEKNDKSGHFGRLGWMWYCYAYRKLINTIFQPIDSLYTIYIYIYLYRSATVWILGRNVWYMLSIQETKWVWQSNEFFGRAHGTTGRRQKSSLALNVITLSSLYIYIPLWPFYDRFDKITRTYFVWRWASSHAVSYSWASFCAHHLRA